MYYPKLRFRSIDQAPAGESYSTVLLSMGPNNETNPPSFNYGDSPSTGVIRAVAWFKGVEPTALTPLQDVIDVDALNALFDKPEETDLSVSFEYDECVVEVTNDGTITIRGASDAGSRELDQETNVLFLAPSSSHSEEEGCDDLLSAVPTSRANVLGVTYESQGTNRLNAWEFEEETPARISLINVGDFTRSSASRPSKNALPPERIEVNTVLDPSDLTTLGIRISEQLSEWESTDEQPVVCFHSLTDLLEATELNRAFRFLHLLTRRLSSAGAIAHFHLDPEAYDEKTVETLRPLFDAVLEIDEDGTWSMCVQ
jgi:hypothetical protein